jgi:hypothetical protein
MFAKAHLSARADGGIWHQVRQLCNGYLSLSRAGAFRFVERVQSTQTSQLASSKADIAVSFFNDEAVMRKASLSSNELCPERFLPKVSDVLCAEVNLKISVRHVRETLTENDSGLIDRLLPCCRRHLPFFLMLRKA